MSQKDPRGFEVLAVDHILWFQGEPHRRLLGEPGGI